MEHRHRHLQLAAPQWCHHGSGCTALEGLIQLGETGEPGLGFAVGFDPLDRVVERGDVRQGRERHHQGHWGVG